MTYRQLDAGQTIETLDTLKNRIRERFEGTSLERVADELSDIARESREKIAWIDRPHFGLRLAVVVVLVLAVGLIAFGLNELLKNQAEEFGLSDTIGLIEAATNEVILVGAALLFLFSLEVRKSA